MNLQIACLHFKVSYGDVEQNKKELLSLFRQEAEQGANIILAPEMSLSGYSFASREDILPFTITENDAFVVQVKEIAAAYSCYICFGAALRVEPEDILYNSALMIGPEGILACYHKVNGEIRWACPGDAVQNNVVQTPWGGIGLLICSDSYFELMPRQTVLKGADVLLIPANWPSAGLDPVEIWQARALENGVHVIACNRTGKDIQMDCSLAQSAWISPDGKVQNRQQGEDSLVMHCSLPLIDGRIDESSRKKRMNSRTPQQYHSIYRSIAAIEDLSSFYEMPEPGELDIHCLIPDKDKGLTDFEKVFAVSVARPALCILPELSSKEEQKVKELCTGKSGEEDAWCLYRRSNEQSSEVLVASYVSESIVIQEKNLPERMDLGPVRLGIIDYAALWHPERIISLAKEGCDLIVLIEKKWTHDMQLLAGARSINHIALAVCCADGGGIWMRPKGHGRWQEQLVTGSGLCSFTLDSLLTRKKRFQDRVDFTTLLKKQ